MDIESIQRSFSGSPFESQVGYCRALRAGNLVFTAGTLAADEYGVIHGETCYEQCCYIFQKLGHALSELGSGLEKVIKVNAYLADIKDKDEFSKAHFEYLGSVQPVATAVQIAGLFAEGARIEIELVALV